MADCDQLQIRSPDRLQKALELPKTLVLSRHKFGFRKRFKIDRYVSKVPSAAARAIQKPCAAQKLSVLVSAKSHYSTSLYRAWAQLGTKGENASDGVVDHTRSITFLRKKASVTNRVRRGPWADAAVLGGSQ